MNSDRPAAPGHLPDDATSTSVGLSAGQAVGGGRYLLIQVLGQGGMGVVWLARDQRLGELLALKFLPAEVRHDAATLDSMRSESLKSRRLTHPNIVRIHDFHEAPGEAPFISMEYVDGDDLGNLRRGQTTRVFSWDYLAPLVRQLCEALHYAHEEKIIHRDLKPSNLMLDGRGRLKLADFGIAATVCESLSRVSVAGTSGTVTSMSPQQLDGRTPTVADDIYALGATLYELLTSKPPFYTGDIPHQVRTCAPDPIAQRLSDFDITNNVPPGVAAMVMACLAKGPEQRPPSVRAVADWIGLTLSTPAPASEPCPRRRVPIALAVTAVVLGMTAGGAVYWKWFLPKPIKTSPAVVPPVNQADSVASSAVAPDPSFAAMFNGRDLNGWKGDARYWSVQDGVIVGQMPQGKGSRSQLLFWEGGSAEDFELRFKYRFTSGNSGVYYRARELPGAEIGGYQFEIWSDKVGNLIETGDDRPRRDLSKRGQRTVAQTLDGRTRLEISGWTEPNLADVDAALRQGGWMEVIITAHGNRLIHKVNGRTVTDVTDEYADRPRAGVIALELYPEPAMAARIEFRDLQIKRLTRAVVTGWRPNLDGGGRNFIVSSGRDQRTSKAGRWTLRPDHGFVGWSSPRDW